MDPGTVIGDRFELAERAGSGGMGAVYRALDRVTGATVAIKLVGAMDDQIVARFVRESRMLEELRHPRIVRHIAHGEAPHGRYLAMEWLAGRDLAARLSQGPLGTQEALVVARGIAEALGAAHRRGVIHRDIKPSNVFLVDDEYDRVKVLDFGVASSAHASTRAITRTGAAVGTPGYMAPEQARATGTVDARADVYALGCVLFEAIAGRPPFVGDSVVGKLVRSVLEETPLLSSVFAGVPPEIDALVARFMAKDPDRRPSDGRAALRAIDALGDVRHTSAPTPRSIPATISTAEHRLLSLVLTGNLRPSLDDDDRTRDTVVTSPEPAVQQTVEAFGGDFEPLGGEATLATFKPSASPTDQVRAAARCALALRERFQEAAIVLSTGRGSSGRMSSEGEVVSRALRLLEIAKENADLGPAILMDEASFGLLEGEFEIFCTLAGHVLIGERDALNAERRVLGRSTPCVGRKRELALLEATFDECTSESVARAVVVKGPPGVGKSRIRQALVRVLRERGAPFELWMARGDVIAAGSPFSLLAGLVRAASGISGSESAAVQREKLARRVVRRVPQERRAETIQFLAEIIGAPFEDGILDVVAAARNDPLSMGDQMRRAFTELVDAECRLQPVVLVLEDLQWGDRATVQFVDTVLRSLADRPLFVVATARPEAEALFGTLWAERGAQEIRVGPLTPKASRALVEHVTTDVSPADVERIVSRAGGHPLLIEEMLRAHQSDSAEHTLPDTALALVEARVLGLEDEARRVLRAASVYGRSFWRGGVAALIADRPPAEVADWLTYLTEQEWIVRRTGSRFSGEVEYGFAQDVVREAVYAMLPEADQTRGHRTAGTWLEKAGERDGVVLARHYERGGQADRAVDGFKSAAEQALDANDFDAAVEYARRALELGGPDLDARTALLVVQAEAHLHRGAFEPALNAALGSKSDAPTASRTWFSAVAVAAAAASKLSQLDVVRDLARELVDLEVPLGRAVPFAASSAVTAVQLLIAGETALAIQLCERLERLETETKDPPPALVGPVMRAVSARWAFTGDPGRALNGLRRAVEAFEATGDARTVCALRKTQGWYAGECGALEEGERALAESIALAERLGLTNLVAHAAYDAASPLIRLGKLDEAQSRLEAALAVFEAQDDRRLASGALGCLAWVHDEAGRHEQAIATARRALDVAPSPPMRISALAFLAQAELGAGATEAALKTADTGLALLGDVGVTEEGTTVLCLVRAEALDRLGRPKAAHEAIADACRRLRQRAERISDRSLRKSFLSRIDENRRTFELGERLAQDVSRSR